MQILYFAWVREGVGLDSETVEPPAEAETVGAVIDWLAGRSDAHGAALADRTRLRAALDQRVAGSETPVAGARELAIFPPVTGG